MEIDIKPAIRRFMNPNLEDIPITGHLSILMHGGKVIENSSSSLAGVPNGHPMGRSCHAEIATMKRYINSGRIRTLSKCTIVNLKFAHNGDLKCSKPCSECLKMLNKYNIKCVIYSTDAGSFIKSKPSQITDAMPSSGYRY